MRSNDSNWYRSKIESINGDKVRVFHCEYGNVETVHKSKLRVLDKKFAKINDLVINAYFAIKSDNEKVLFNEMRKAFDDGAKEFSFKISERFQDGWILEPIEISNGKNLFDDFVKSGKAVRIEASELTKKFKQKSVEPEKKPNESKIDKNVIAEKKEKPQKKEPAIIQKTKVESVPEVNELKFKLTALANSTDLYLMQIEDVAKFQKLQSDIQIISSSAPKLNVYDENTLCLAKQPFDLQWYRAKIVDSDEVMITVRCLDDGKTFSVEDKNLLKTMPVALKEKKFFALACSLPIKVEREFDEDVTELLLQKVETEFTAKFLWKNADKNYVELISNGEGIVDILLQKKLAEKLDFFENGNAFTSHINSTSSFFLQLECDQLKLDVISKFFEEMKGNFKNYDVKVGDIVAALYPEDDCWYRSRIDKIEKDNKYSVTFIDFGNSCEVSKIGKIEEPAIIDLPKMSKHCSLFIPTSHSSEISETKFDEICAGGATILNVRLIKPGNPAEIEIFVDGKNILELLIS